MKFKIIIILVILFIANSMFSQQGISLLNPKGGDLEFIREHHRIKIKTDNGKNIAGQFTILDAETIKIKDHLIHLYQIVKIRKASGFSTFIETVLMTVGVSILLPSLYNIPFAKTSDDLGFAAYIGLPTGSLLFVLPLTSKNKHKKENWKYKIITNSKPNN
jgi:hypothetical protein